MTCGLTLDGGVDAMARSCAIIGIGAGSRDESVGNRAGTFESSLSMVSMGGCRSRNRVQGAQLDQADPFPFKTSRRASARKSRGRAPDDRPRITAQSMAIDHNEALGPHQPVLGWGHRLLQARFPPTARASLPQGGLFPEARWSNFNRPRS